MCSPAACARSSRANRVVINFSGDPAFLQHPSIESSKNYNGMAEIRLHEGDDGQALLAEAIRHARVSRFEVMEPTLEEIFIEKVTRESTQSVDGGKVHA